MLKLTNKQAVKMGMTKRLKRENGSMVVVEQGRQKVLFGVLLVVVLPS